MDCLLSSLFLILLHMGLLTCLIDGWVCFFDEFHICNVKMHISFLLLELLRWQSTLWSLFLRWRLHPVVDGCIVWFLFICYQLVNVLVNLYSIGHCTSIVFEFHLELPWLIVASLDIKSGAASFLESWFSLSDLPLFIVFLRSFLFRVDGGVKVFLLGCSVVPGRQWLCLRCRRLRT